ncbi:MAG: hypothetical protein P9M03_06740 [Candidatus Theseobacter exili]|nr:hypothetical protein [Candidatus Theseobacter exili]
MSVLHKIGLHPLTACGMLVVDWMLFSADVTGVGWLISCLVAAVLVMPCVLIQKFAYSDAWSIAIAKGAIIGLITAIPTPLPSIITGAGGVMGTIGSSKQNLIK